MTSQEPALTVRPVQQPLHWRDEPVKEFVGPLSRIPELLPTFDRTPFGTRLDVIVRRSGAEGQGAMPVGTVSKKYVLVQHAWVVDAIGNALRAAAIDPSGLHCRLTTSESGARVGLHVALPDSFAFTPPDGHRMALTFECFNSVDRTAALFAVLGWFRFVCSNGLVVGTTHARMRHAHRPPLRIEELEPVLTDGLAAAERDREDLRASTAHIVSTDALRAWVDGPVAEAWGALAAARVHAIVTTGRDGEPSRTPRSTPPHARQMVRPTAVPGAEAPCRNQYGIAQALAWVAARRNDMTERVAWRNGIPELLRRLQ